MYVCMYLSSRVLRSTQGSSCATGLRQHHGQHHAAMCQTSARRSELVLHVPFRSPLLALEILPAFSSSLAKTSRLATALRLDRASASPSQRILSSQACNALARQQARSAGQVSTAPQKNIFCSPYTVAFASPPAQVRSEQANSEQRVTPTEIGK